MSHIAGFQPVIQKATRHFLEIGVYVDSLTIVMFAMITLRRDARARLLASATWREDKRFPRFFTYLGLFCFSMLGLVLGGTLLQLFIFWELVGLCSYLLIGFWYEKKTREQRGDQGVRRQPRRRLRLPHRLRHPVLSPRQRHAAGHVDVARHGRRRAGDHAARRRRSSAPTLLTVMGIGLFFGAVGKSAQFPLHVWLPDAMEGPTPVSALIHAATMVAAGVYLVGRIFPILTPDAKLFIAIIGCIDADDGGADRDRADATSRRSSRTRRSRSSAT